MILEIVRTAGRVTTST